MRKAHLLATVSPAGGLAHLPWLGKVIEPRPGGYSAASDPDPPTLPLGSIDPVGQTYWAALQSNLDTWWLSGPTKGSPPSPGKWLGYTQG